MQVIHISSSEIKSSLALSERQPAKERPHEKEKSFVLSFLPFASQKGTLHTKVMSKRKIIIVDSSPDNIG